MSDTYPLGFNPFASWASDRPGLINSVDTPASDSPFRSWLSQQPGLINSRDTAALENPYYRLANALLSAPIPEQPTNALANPFLARAPIAISHCDLGLRSLSFDVYPLDKLTYVRDAIYIATRSQTSIGWPSEYVGQTKRFVTTRFDEHAQDSPLWWLYSTHVHVLVVENDHFRSVLETQLIDFLNPPGNEVRGSSAHFL